MDRSVVIASGIALVGLLSGCGPGMIVPLQATVPVAEAGQELLIVTRSSVPDPLPVSGAHVAYGGLDRALTEVVREAARPFARSHVARHPGGFQLLIELVQAEAQRQDVRVRVALSIRATLHAHVGNQYLAQTQTYCQHSAPAAPRNAAPVFYDCMRGIGRQLAGWLGGVEP